MVRPDAFIFGYRRVSVSESDIPKLASILMKVGISAEISHDGSFTIYERDYKRFKTAAKGRIHFSISDNCGLPAFLLSYKHRYGIILGMLCAVFMSVWLSGLVWDIRISGNSLLTDSEVVDMLDTQGFSVGDKWKKADKNRVEADVLLNYSSIAWISINRRGTVAYVEIVESENIGIVKPPAPQYSNIVADRDAVIDEISVVSGMAMVKVGDVVKKGDILISGITLNEQGNSFCRAVGNVRGHTSEIVKVEEGREYVKKTEKRSTIDAISITVFKKTVNIFKNYGNSHAKYDIIYKNKDYTPDGDKKLPFSVCIAYRCPYTEETAYYSDSELISVIRDTMTHIMADKFADADILKLRTDGGFTDDGYRLVTEVHYEAEIGEEREIKVDGG